MGSWPEPIQCVPDARCASSACGVGAVLIDVLMTKCRQGLHLDLLHGTSYNPQHRNLGEGGRREVLTGEAVGIEAANGVEGENSS
jgi:hypothetical protein